MTDLDEDLVPALTSVITVFLPPRTQINLTRVSATGSPTQDDLSLSPFYVQSVAKGLPWPKCSVLPCQ